MWKACALRVQVSQCHARLNDDPYCILLFHPLRHLRRRPRTHVLVMELLLRSLRLAHHHDKGHTGMGCQAVSGPLLLTE